MDYFTVKKGLLELQICYNYPSARIESNRIIIEQIDSYVFESTADSKFANFWDQSLIGKAVKEGIVCSSTLCHQSTPYMNCNK